MLNKESSPGEVVIERNKGGILTKLDVIKEVARVAELSQIEAGPIVEAIIDSMVKAIQRGEKVEVRGFGSFHTRQRRARIGRNPKNGAVVKVPPKRIPYFTPSKQLRTLVDTVPD